MEKKRTNNMDMVNGPLVKNIFLFAIPLMATNFISMLFNAIDTIVVGKFAGEAALAAVGATGSLVFLITALFNGLSMGTNVVVAQLIGKGNSDGIRKSVHSSYAMALYGGILMICVGWFGSHTFLSWMSTPSDIINDSTLYMQIYLSSSIFILAYNFGAAILRAKGDTKRPLYFLIVGGLANAGLNLYCVIVLHLGVVGVAVATFASQFISAILVTLALISDNDDTHLDLKAIAFDKESSLEILRIGIPAGIQSMMYSISNVVMQSSINSFDSSTIVAGNTAGNNIENFCYIGMMSFSQACITFTSQNYGAKKYRKIKTIMLLTLGLCTVAAIGLSLSIWSVRYPLLSLYTDVPEVMDIGSIRLTFVALPLFLNGVLDVFVGSLRGIGKSAGPTILMVIGICGVRLLWLLTYFPLHRELYVIYLSYGISWAFTSVIEFILWVYYYNKMIKDAQIAGELVD